MQARYERLIRELRCLAVPERDDRRFQCDSSPSDLRRQVRELMAAGKTDEEILQYMTDRYGDYVLYKPPVAPRTLAAVGRAVLLLVGRRRDRGVVIVRKSRLPDTDPPIPAWVLRDRFIIACAAMVAAALLWIMLPLLRPKAGRGALAQGATHLGHRARCVRARAGATVCWPQQLGLEETGAAMAREQQIDDLLGQLKAKLAENPKDVNGWLMLGRSYSCDAVVSARGSMRISRRTICRRPERRSRSSDWAKRSR